MDDRPEHPVPCPDPFPLGPAAPGNERLLQDLIKGADVHQLEVVPIAFCEQLHCREASGHAFTTIQGIGIKRTDIPCSPTRKNVCRNLRDIPYMMIEDY
jgi:hypothetical protein